MANTQLDMRKIKQIFRLYTEGVSKREISKRLDVSRNTVKKYIHLLSTSGFTSEELNELLLEDLRLLISPDEEIDNTRHKYLYDLFPEVSKLLKKVGNTRFLIWESYLADYPDLISYSRFCHLFKLWSRKQSPVMRFNHKAGDKMFVDYTGKKLSIVDPQTGEITSLEVFVAILGASGYTYVEACASQKREDFISCIVNALNFYGGVPRAIVTDNLKSAVTKSDKYEPILNESLLSLGLHYNTTILPTRAYKPRDKALVENMVRTVYTRIFSPLSSQTFYTIPAINKAVSELNLIHNKTDLQIKDCSRLDLFESIEKPELACLPVINYQIRNYAVGTVYKSSHIRLGKDKHHYSAPFSFIGKKVQIIYDKDHVEIYYKQRRIALHKRSLKRFGYTTDPQHVPSTHRFVAEWNPDKFLNWSIGIGPHCHTFISLLLAKKQHPEQSYKSCVGVLALGKKVGNKRLNNACKRALGYERINYQTVKTILKKRLDYITEDTQQEKDLPNHHNIRGKSYYK